MSVLSVGSLPFAKELVVFRTGVIQTESMHFFELNKRHFFEIRIGTPIHPVTFAVPSKRYFRYFPVCSRSGSHPNSGLSYVSIGNSLRTDQVLKVINVDHFRFKFESVLLKI
jgi:hypothetical protein